MSQRWPDKFIIGITGNIAVGKSVVRRMLEHLGAYGIDADHLAHRAIAKNAPGYEPVVRTFGTWILNPDGEINRARLAKLVFSDPEAMRLLEEIVHPLVLQAVAFLISRAKRPVIAVEAIKLLETDLRQWSDSIWVVVASPELQLQRLMRKRGMNESEAYQRILAQTPQEEKARQAHVVIHNDRDLEHTWKQVVDAWNRVVPERFRKAVAPAPTPATAAPAKAPAAPAAPTAQPQLRLQARRATPKDAQRLAEFIALVTQGREKPTRVDILTRFGDKAYTVVEADGRIVGLLGWQVENLVARVTEMYLHPDVPEEAVLETALEHITQQAKELQSEIMLVFPTEDLFRRTTRLWRRLGYEPRSPRSLDMLAWREAAEASQPPGTVLLFRALRKDRVLHPL